MKEKKVRFSVSMPEDLVKKMDDMTKKYNLNRSQFICFIMSQGIELGETYLQIMNKLLIPELPAKEEVTA